MVAFPSALYKFLCRLGDKFVYPLLPTMAKPAWNHPAGPKTVFFWSPTIKWVLVLAGISDLKRPPEKLSVFQRTLHAIEWYIDYSNWLLIRKAIGQKLPLPLNQWALKRPQPHFLHNTALAATGAIWTRYCFVIIPKCYYLASVNFFVFCIGLVQLLRIAAYNNKLTKNNKNET